MKLNFTGDEGSAIPLDQAAGWTAAYRETHPEEVQSRFFGRKIIEQILAQAGCKGIRLYFGLDGAALQLVAVGADGEENDQLGKNNIVADDTMMGPPHCGQNNVLNS